MKLALSNIAWHPDEDNSVSALMHDYDVTGIEIAPTKIWSDPLAATDTQICAYARKWQRWGIEISSMQALLFGRPELTIFENKDKRQQTIDYLCQIIRLGGILGAGPLVFGSPKNRLVGKLDKHIAEEIAIEFFTTVGEFAAKYGCLFCIEPNPTDYGCDYITTSTQARELVQSVNHPGFGLHLDAAAMTMSGENIAEQLPISISGLSHFHISEPNLAPVGTGAVDHALISALLHDSEYKNWFSIEMRPPDENNNLAGIAATLAFVNDIYRF